MTRALRYIAGVPLLVVGYLLVGIGMLGEAFLMFTWGLGTTLADLGHDCWGIKKRRW